MKRVIIAGFIGAIVLFFYGMISWTVLPWHTKTYKPIPAESVVVNTLQQNISDTGAYYFPGIPVHSPDADAATKKTMNDQWIAKHKQGPLGMVIFHAQGIDPMSPMIMIQGFIISLLGAMLAAGFLKISCAGKCKYAVRVMFVTTLGIFVALVSDLNYWNWLFFPTDYTLVMIADDILSWFLAGLAIAFIVKTKNQQSRPAADV